MSHTGMSVSLDEGAVLTRIAAAFSPFLKTAPQASSIRTSLAAYLESYVISDSEDGLGRYPQSFAARSIPEQVTGLRRKYLEALRDNLAVRRRQEELFNRTCSGEYTASDRA